MPLQMKLESNPSHNNKDAAPLELASRCHSHPFVAQPNLNGSTASIDQAAAVMRVAGLADSHTDLTWTAAFSAVRPCLLRR